MKYQSYSPTELLCSKIHPSPANKRAGKTNEIESLAESIRNQGLLQYPIVRPHPANEGEYEIVAGERRLRACCMLGDTIPVIIRNLTDARAHEITVTENLQREDPSPMEESAGVCVLLNDGKTYEEVADCLGKPVSWVARRAKLSNLSDKFLNALGDPEDKTGVSKLSASHLELIARFEKSIQDSFFDQSGWDEWNTAEQLSLKDLKEELDGFLRKLSTVPWKLTDKELLPEAGACSECQKRTSCQTSLFDQLEERGKVVDQCIDSSCWAKKMQLFIEKKEAALRESNPDLVKVSNSYSADFIPEEHPLRENVVTPHFFSECKKSDPDAKQALVIDGAGAGSVKWVRTYGGMPGSSMAHRGSQPKTKTLAERREALDKRRNVRIIDKIITLICKEIAAPDLILNKSVDSIMVAAISFGCKRLSDIDDTSNYDFDKWKLFDKQDVRNLSESDLAIELMRCTLPKWKEDLQGDKNGVGAGTGGACRTDNAKRVCAFLGVDFKGLVAEVKSEIKEPKSWALLNEDGTPKTGKEAAQPEPEGKKKKKPAKKKAAKKSSKKRASVNDLVDEEAGE